MLYFFHMSFIPRYMFMSYLGPMKSWRTEKVFWVDPEQAEEVAQAPGLASPLSLSLSPGPVSVYNGTPTVGQRRAQWTPPPPTQPGSQPAAPAAGPAGVTSRAV